MIIINEPKDPNKLSLSTIIVTAIAIFIILGLAAVYYILSSAPY